jgi:hypothetical protein
MPMPDERVVLPVVAVVVVPVVCLVVVRLFPLPSSLDLRLGFAVVVVRADRSLLFVRGDVRERTSRFAARLAVLRMRGMLMD